jgi:prevent-host-death family protein
MPKRTKPVSVTELRANAGRVMRRAKGSREPIVLTERGRPSAVLLSLAAYAALRGSPDRALLREIGRGERDVTRGRTVSFEQVRADVEKVLSRVHR